PAAAARAAPAMTPIRRARPIPRRQPERNSARARAQTAATSWLPGGGCYRLGDRHGHVFFAAVVDPAVPHADDARGGVGHLLVVGDHEDRLAARVEAPE